MARRFKTDSRHAIKLTEASIITPPSTTQPSTGSENTAAPKIVAQTSCKNVTGCVTVIGAARKASVMVKWPMVAKIATKNSQASCANVGVTYWAKANGARPIGTMIDNIATTTTGLTSSAMRFAIR